MADRLMSYEVEVAVVSATPLGCLPGGQHARVILSQRQVDIKRPPPHTHVRPLTHPAFQLFTFSDKQISMKMIHQEEEIAMVKPKSSLHYLESVTQ